MTYRLNSGYSWGFLDGQCVNEIGIWIFNADSLKMKIDNENLIGFRSETDTIRIKKVES